MCSIAKVLAFDNIIIIVIIGEKNRSTNIHTHTNDHLHKQLYLNLIERSTTLLHV